MQKYIINNKEYKVSFAEAKDLALFDNDTTEIFFDDQSKNTHWQYDGQKWFLALGGKHE